MNAAFYAQAAPGSGSNLTAQGGRGIGRPMPGTGTRLRSNAAGFAYSVPQQGGSFPHPFRPALGTNAVSFARGVVDGIYTPTIKGVPISGDPSTGRVPMLPLEFSAANAQGESWCCLEITGINAQGKVDKNSKIEVVHTGQPISNDPAVGRGRGGTLCMILWRDKQALQAYEIAYFNLRYQRVTLGQNQGPPEHLFF